MNNCARFHPAPPGTTRHHPHKDLWHLSAASLKKGDRGLGTVSEHYSKQETIEFILWVTNGRLNTGYAELTVCDVRKACIVKKFTF